MNCLFDVWKSNYAVWYSINLDASVKFCIKSNEEQIAMTEVKKS